MSRPGRVYLDGGALLLLDAQDGGEERRRLRLTLEQWFQAGGEAVSSSLALLRVRLYWSRKGPAGRKAEQAFQAKLRGLLAETTQLEAGDLERAQELQAACGLGFYGALHAALALRMGVDRIYGLEAREYGRAPGLEPLELAPAPAAD